MSYFQSDIRSFGRSSAVVDELHELGVTVPGELVRAHRAARLLRGQLEQHRRTAPPTPDDLVTGILDAEDPETVLSDVTAQAQAAEAHRQAGQLLDAARQRAEALVSSTVRRLGPEVLVGLLQPVHATAAAELARLHQEHPGVGDDTPETAVTGPDDRRTAYLAWREAADRLTTVENLAEELRQTHSSDHLPETWWDNLTVFAWRRTTQTENPSGGAPPTPPTYAQMLDMGATRVLRTASEVKAAVAREKARQRHVTTLKPREQAAIRRGDTDVPYDQVPA